MARFRYLTVESVECQIRYWENVRQILLRTDETPDDSIETRIVKKYLRLQKVVEVAKELNNENYTLTSQATGKPRKYTANDISDIIRHAKIDDEEMLNLARAILKDHTAFINRLYN